MPTSSDDAEINMTGIDVTHSVSTSDAVNSLSVASGSTLSISNGSLSIATDSTISGNLVERGDAAERRASPSLAR